MTAPERAAAEVPIRDAATVALLRDRDGGGIEAWMLTRVTAMAFAAGMSVFPGGRAETQDALLPFAGDLVTPARQFGCDDAMARLLVGAAVRETFEETGVLLTRGDPSPLLAGPDGLAAARVEVEAGRRDFGELLRQSGLVADADLVRPWARWVTPAGEARRYDARFFVAALPGRADAADVTTESSAAEWIEPATALAQGRSGDRLLMPPTVATLTSLVPFERVADVLAAVAARDLTPVRPRLQTAADGSHAVLLPDGSAVPLPRAEQAGA